MLVRRKGLGDGPGEMDRIVGTETEYGCLTSDEAPHFSSDIWPAKVKNYLFRKASAGTIDLHYRDYEEPPGNGGFLLNGGRLYLDMGHIEYASPECLHLRDLVTYDLAGTICSRHPWRCSARLVMFLLLRTTSIITPERRSAAMRII